MKELVVISGKGGYRENEPDCLLCRLGGEFCDR